MFLNCLLCGNIVYYFIYCIKVILAESKRYTAVIVYLAAIMYILVFKTLYNKFGTVFWHCSVCLIGNGTIRCVADYFFILLLCLFRLWRFLVYRKCIINGIIFYNLNIFAFQYIYNRSYHIGIVLIIIDFVPANSIYNSADRYIIMVYFSNKVVTAVSNFPFAAVAFNYRAFIRKELVYYIT